MARWRARRARLERTRGAAARPPRGTPSRIGSGRISTGPVRASRSIGAPAASLDEVEDRRRGPARPAARSARTPCRGRGRAASARCRGRCRAGASPSRRRGRPGEPRSSSAAGERAWRPTAAVEPRQTPHVGFDNVGGHRPGSLGEGTARWNCAERVVVVTGASRGSARRRRSRSRKRGAQGRAPGRRRKDRLEELADRIGRAGGSALAWTCDVTDTAQLEKLPGIVQELIGRPVDVLVNNAGRARRRAVRRAHARADRSRGRGEPARPCSTRPARSCRACSRRGSGHIVNVASLAGRFASPGAAVYSATKHAVVAFSESLALRHRAGRRAGHRGEPGTRGDRGIPAERASRHDW